MKNILVFFGGKSCEHDVSTLTGVMTANCLDGKGYNSVPVYIGRDGRWYGGKELKNHLLYEYIEMRITTENPLIFNCKKALISRRNKTAEHLICR